MRTRFRSESDEWTTAGLMINSPEALAAIRTVLDERGPVIVEWRHYRGSSAPDRLIFEDFGEFQSWLQARTYAGDSIWVWDF